MQHVLTPFSISRSTYAWWENAFTEQELNWLQEQAKMANQKAVVGGGSSGAEINPNIRRSQVFWMSKTFENSWVFEKLSRVVSTLNAKHFHFDLTGFGEDLQLTNYDQSDHGMYGWHVDGGAPFTPCRKLSIVMQLTDPSQYEGGNLQITTSSNPETIKKQRGLIVAFPSYIMHQVTPVTNGSRQSLVAWITGPEFR